MIGKPKEVTTEYYIEVFASCRQLKQTLFDFFL